MLCCSLLLLQLRELALCLCFVSASLSLSTIAARLSEPFCCLLFGATVRELQQVATHFLWSPFVAIVVAADKPNKTNEKHFQQDDP